MANMQTFKISMGGWQVFAPYRASEGILVISRGVRGNAGGAKSKSLFAEDILSFGPKLIKSIIIET
jgi:hypothetical protein